MSSQPNLKKGMSAMGELIFNNKEHDSRFSPVITGILMFDFPPKLVEVRALVTERLLKFERFSCKAVRDQCKYWEPVKIDLDHHLTEYELPSPADTNELNKFIEELYHSADLSDKERPLWHAYLVPNYQATCRTSGSKKHGALILRVDHAIGDGVSLVHVLYSLVDFPSGTDAERSTGVKKRAVRREGIIETILNPLLLSDRVWSFLHGVFRGLHEPFARPDEFSVIKPPEDLWHHPPTVALASGDDKIELEKVKEIGHLLGCTVNDVLCAVLALTVTRQLEEAGSLSKVLGPLFSKALGEKLQSKPDDDPMPKCGFVRGYAPVNTRAAASISDMTQFGNQFVMASVFFPVGHAHKDPISVLRYMKSHLDALKRSPETIIATFFVSRVLPLLAGDWFWWFSRKTISIPSFLFTNVPGPSQKVIFYKSTVEDLMFYVNALGPACSVFSLITYNGKISLGVQTNSFLLHNPHRMVEMFKSEFDNMHKTIMTGSGVCKSGNKKVNGQAKISSHEPGLVGVPTNTTVLCLRVVRMCVLFVVLLLFVRWVRG
eukprot:c11118_g1_i1.p1 GENE.c11118_g1_i1~~c11118_g1_i1.p1  ORF type:complete len:547 (-),score=90.28 c11118_g1_i1:40-1680(-)